MKYLLDTNVCVALIRQKPTAVSRNLTRHPIDAVGVSSITVAELVYGVHKSNRPTQNQAALEEFLAPLTVLDFDYAATLAYGRVRAYLEQQGMPIGSLDTLIAAHALSRDLILVTNNVNEFARVRELTIEDWTKE